MTAGGAHDHLAAWQPHSVATTHQPHASDRHHTTQVRRVDNYTHVSMYLVLLTGPAMTVPGLARGLAVDHTATFVAVLAWLAVLGTTGSWVLAATMRTYPASTPLPVTRLAALAAATLASLSLLPVPGVDDTISSWLALVAGYVASVALAPLLPTRAAVYWALALGVAMSLLSSNYGRGALYMLVAGFMIGTVRVSLWLRDVVRELDSARSAQSALAVAEERLRFSRDLHDTLGRNLSAIAVTSELAATLHEKNDPRAADRMLQVRDLAHESLGETRELVRGYRDVSFTAELAGATALLEAAGVTCTVDVDDDTATLSPEEAEMAAWVVREAATNVLRHSRATECTVRLRDRRLQIGNDGAGEQHGGTAGSGLAGLRERLKPAGATLEIDWRDGEFTVTAQFGGRNNGDR